MPELLNVKKTVDIILFGESITDKLKLLLILSFLRIYRFYLSAKMNAAIDEIVRSICKNVIVSVDGIKYSLIDEESLWIVINYESFVSPWFKPSKDQVVLDVGAHIGKYTLKTAKSVGMNGKVIAIEGDPENFRKLEKNIMLNNIQNALLFNLVAWNEERTLKIFHGKCAGWNSVKIDWKLGWHEAKAKPLDKIIEECSINRLDLVKIDVEDAEWEVLASLGETISKFRPKIIVELSNDNFEKVRLLIEEHEYGLVKVSNTFDTVICGVRRAFAYFICLPLSS
jgi:FkbM family methyltransferase